MSPRERRRCASATATTSRRAAGRRPRTRSTSACTSRAAMGTARGGWRSSAAGAARATRTSPSRRRASRARGSTTPTPRPTSPAGRRVRSARPRSRRAGGPPSSGSRTSPRGPRATPTAGSPTGSRSCSTIPRSTTTRTRVRLAARRRPGASPAGTRATSTSTPSTRATPTRRCPRPSTSRSARWRAAAPARLPLAHRPQHRQRVAGARPLPRRPPGQPRDPERGGDNLSRPPQRPRGRRAGRLPDGSDPRAPRGRLARPDAGRTAGAQLPRGGARGRRPYEINHPTLFPSPPFPANLCRGCEWEYSPAETGCGLVDGIEIATGPADINGPARPGPNPFTVTAIGFWERALDRGHRIAAVGGSDSHRAGRVEQPTQSPVGEPTTVVFAHELSTRDIRDGVRAGHTYVKIGGNDRPDLRFEARAAGSSAPPAIMGDIVRGRRVELVARVLGGAPGGSPGGPYTLTVLKDGRTPTRRVPRHARPLPPRGARRRTRALSAPARPRLVDRGGLDADLRRGLRRRRWRRWRPRVHAPREPRRRRPARHAGPRRDLRRRRRRRGQRRGRGRRGPRRGRERRAPGRTRARRALRWSLARTP